ncbi:hypothetical protein evm_001271 [Chilo suppressalis]|nr:hypothetical protein evm_001271 [Chilo suppressalis]
MQDISKTVHAGAIAREQSKAAGLGGKPRRNRENLCHLNLKSGFGPTFSVMGVPGNLVISNCQENSGACAFTAKNTHFLPLPSLQGTTLTAARRANISMLGMEVRSDLNPKELTISKTVDQKLHGKLQSPEQRCGVFFTPDSNCGLLYNTQSAFPAWNICVAPWDGSPNTCSIALDKRKFVRTNLKGQSYVDDIV